MLKLAPVTFDKISSWFVDYQKKSKNFEMPPEEAELIGIYRGDDLIGYFITLVYNNGLLEINQGYLRPEARHKNLIKIATRLLEDQAKQVGVKKIVFSTNRAVGSYIQFVKSMGFSIERAIFSKAVK